jgi:preprotein translocase SecF subunit
MIDLVSKRWLFLLVSFIIIVPGTVAIIAGGLKPGIDFTGGTLWQVRTSPEFAGNTEEFKSALSEAGYGETQVKAAEIGEAPNITNTIVMVVPGNLQAPEEFENRKRIEETLISRGLVAGETVTETRTIAPTTPVTATATVTGTTAVTGTATITGTAVSVTGTVTATGTTTGTTGTDGTPLQTVTEVRQRFKANEVIDFRSVGPTVGTELQWRAMVAVGLASLAILLYLTLVFRRVPNSFRYGVTAIIAVLHDVLVVLGIFAILGLLFGVEIDALFITAMLTVIGFSVHDTIVVFDRVRENIMKRRFERFDDVVNYSLVQTLARSINTSVTVLITLFALYLFGGVSIKPFVLALLIGILSGTYSSIFNASMMLVIWENREWRRFFGGGSTPAPEAPRRATAR